MPPPKRSHQNVFLWRMVYRELFSRHIWPYRTLAAYVSVLVQSVTPLQRSARGGAVQLVAAFGFTFHF